jgi:inositol-hexakisphosphate kinase
MHHVKMLQRKLELLLHTIRQLPSYRFFGSSLLVIYDGDPLSTNEIDIRMIDFAHSVLDEEMYTGLKDMTYPPSQPDQPDLGYILGLQTLLDVLNRMQ